MQPQQPQQPINPSEYGLEEQEPKSWWKGALKFLFVMLVIALLLLYFFIPFNTVDFGVKSGHTNFSLISAGETNTQFYPNMRFPTTTISYKIDNCTLKKIEDMQGAFEIISKSTDLEFYSVSTNEEISVTCDSRNKIEGGLFIAGEGGAKNITRAGDFSVISEGIVLLIKESKCERPNIAIHELLHVLGFEHSLNPNNIMYNISRCNQIIGDDTIELIKELYSLPSYPDLVLENVSATMNGRFLDTNISVRNNGLAAAPNTSISIYAEDKLVKEIQLSPLGVGHGSLVSSTNFVIKDRKVQELKFVINSDFDELDKKNNELVMVVGES
ncbi:matrixin family metalloprotease [Candidatus Pacearchaeota archaeon]|nr:matrixin family metalloprotease [Candidatus Pacearchaeota archaeon]